MGAKSPGLEDLNNEANPQLLAGQHPVEHRQDWISLPAKEPRQHV
jgi:hypothetical protein